MEIGDILHELPSKLV